MMTFKTLVHRAARTGLLLAVAAVASGATVTEAALTFYLDQAQFETAAGGHAPTPGGINWADGFQARNDTSFQFVPLNLLKLSVVREGPEPGATNFVDVAPYISPFGFTTTRAELFTNFDEGTSVGTQVRMTFVEPNVAFGFLYQDAGDDEGVTMDVFNGTTLLGSEDLRPANGSYLGFVLTGGEVATSVRFRSRSLIAGPTGEGFAMDFMSGKVFIPEPTTWAMAILAMLAGKRIATKGKKWG